MKGLGLFLIVIAILVGVGVFQYFSAAQERELFKLDVEKLLQKNISTPKSRIQEEITKNAENYNIDPAVLSVRVVKEKRSEWAVIEYLTSGIKVPDTTTVLSAEVTYTKSVLFFHSEFRFKATVIHYKKEHPHKNMIEDALESARKSGK